MSESSIKQSDIPPLSHIALSREWNRSVVDSTCHAHQSIVEGFELLEYHCQSIVEGFELLEYDCQSLLHKRIVLIYKVLLPLS